MKKSILISLTIVLLAVGWMASGMLGEPAPDELQAAATQDSETTKSADSDKSTSKIAAVQVQDIEARIWTRTMIVRGRTEASRSVVIKAETSGRIVGISAEEGHMISKGNAIASINMQDRAARLAEAKARVNQRELEYGAAKRLEKQGYRAKTSAAKNLADLEDAKASVRQIQLEIGNTRPKAPFDGFLEERFVEVGDFVQVGQDIARLVDADPMLVIAQVSELEIGQLQVGQTGAARLSTGKLVEGVIRFVGTIADPQTRTFRVELEVQNNDFAIRDGMTAELVLPTRETFAHFVSPAVLALDDEGNMGVRVVDESNVVRFMPVNVAGSEKDGVWLLGLPNAVTLITVGQEFVSQGQVVAPVAAITPKS